MGIQRLNMAGQAVPWGPSSGASPRSRELICPATRLVKLGPKSHEGTWLRNMSIILSTTGNLSMFIHFPMAFPMAVFSTCFPHFQRPHLFLPASLHRQAPPAPPAPQAPQAVSASATQAVAPSPEAPVVLRGGDRERFSHHQKISTWHALNISISLLKSWKCQEKNIWRLENLSFTWLIWSTANFTAAVWRWNSFTGWSTLRHQGLHHLWFQVVACDHPHRAACLLLCLTKYRERGRKKQNREKIIENPWTSPLLLDIF
jgi:hypothetical protein